ncbi:fimbrial protein, partial [Escherichia coli]|nr:fimbrial protein [Escherichia coli]
AADNLTFKGKLIIPACTVTKAEVDWGNVEIQTLSPDGSGHQKDFTVDMNCPYSLGAMKVTITSNGQTGNSILVPNTSTVSGDGLLIYLYNSNNSGIGNAVTLGSQFTPGKITGTAPARKITLYAKLGYKGNMQNLQAGAFAATATLVASYS